MELIVDETVGTCRLVAANVDALADSSAFSSAFNVVSPYRQAKVVALKFAKDKRLKLMAGLLLDYLLSERGLRESDMEYGENEFGKPYFIGYDGLYFSLSHSGTVAAAALDSAEVGVDVERLSDFPLEIAEPRNWTAFESGCKAAGEGIAYRVDSGNMSAPSEYEYNHYEVAGHLICLARTAVH